MLITFIIMILIIRIVYIMHIIHLIIQPSAHSAGLVSSLRPLVISLRSPVIREHRCSSCSLIAMFSDVSRPPLKVLGSLLEACLGHCELQIDCMEAVWEFLEVFGSSTNSSWSLLESLST